MKALIWRRETQMKGKKHSPEQVIAKLRQAERDLADGSTVGQVCQKLGISEPTFTRWQKQYGGMEGAEAKRLRDLEAENSRLKRLVADLSLNVQVLQDVVKKAS